MIVNDMSSGMARGDIVGYFFGRTRPPELHAYKDMFLPMEVLPLKTTGWGPPAMQNQGRQLQ